jgi:hypothetical protein
MFFPKRISSFISTRNWRSARRRAADGVQENLAARDQRDSQRASAPLMIALGAKVINNSHMTSEQTSGLLLKEIRSNGLLKNEFQLQTWLDFFSRDVRGLFSLARFQCGARAANGRRHSRLEPRELSRSAAGRFGIAPRHQLSRAREPFPFPGVGALLRSWNSVPVDRDGGGAAGLKAILDRLLAGGAIILFPEGTRTKDGRLQKARSGIGLTVIKSDAVVIPVRTFGTFEAYGKITNFRARKKSP